MNNSSDDFLRILSDMEDISTSEVPLADLTTLHLGGQSKGVVHCQAPDAAASTLKALDDADIPVLIVGGGSNLVIGENLRDLVVLHMQAGSVQDNIEIDAQSGIVTATCCVSWDDVVQASIAAGLGGLECLSGIPGNAGATPVQNVGAYGVEVSQYLSRVELYDRTTGVLQWHDPADLDLAYRYSNIKFTHRALVTRAEFRLHADGLSAPIRYGELARRLGTTQGAEQRFDPADVRAQVLTLRRSKGMLVDPDDPDTYSVGSFFTNPILIGEAAHGDFAQRIERLRADGVLTPDQRVVQFDLEPDQDGHMRSKLSAGWLIQNAGIEPGWQVPGGTGRARISSKHTLSLTNHDHATTEELVELAHAVQQQVGEVFGVHLEPEPLTIGVTI